MIVLITVLMAAATGIVLFIGREAARFKSRKDQMYYGTRKPDWKPHLWIED